MKNKKIIMIVLLIISIITVLLVSAFLIVTEVFNLGCPNPNLSGYCIKGTTLTGYMGLGRKITIPKKVETIKMGAFNVGKGRGIFLKEIVIPGTVRKIDDFAIADSNVDKIVIEEGVEVIGSFAFHNISLEEIWFPKSLKVVEGRILDCEELCTSTTLKIHYYKSEKMDYYFKNNKPYYKNVEYIYR